MKYMGMAVALGLATALVAAAAPPEFVAKPTLSGDGDRITIRFAVNSFCDATVAVEEAAPAAGHPPRIVRHLACGVLGPNAPTPFLRNSLKQAVVWDGKNDKGEYLDSRNRLTVRVSLGLRARYERNLMWCPKKRGPTTGSGLGRNPALMTAGPDGVYVYDGEFAGEHIRLFDHDGNYVRTVYPFPAARVREVVGLKMLPGPQSHPLRWHQELVTLLTAAHESYGGDWPAHLGPHSYGLRPQAIAVRGTRLALPAWRLNRLSTDGSSGGLDLTGPGVTFPASLRALHEFRGGVFDIAPRSVALDPTGAWLYLSGYAWSMPWNQDGLHGVARLRFDGREPPMIFAGSMTQNQEGRDDTGLSLPLGVTCDGAGRVYICDHMNDRIQIFSPAGALLKTLRTLRPVQVDIHPRSGELFVFSWLVGNDRLTREVEQAERRHEPMKPVPPTLTRYAAIDWSQGAREAAPQALGRHPLPLDGVGPTARPYMGVIGVGLPHRVAVDFWGAEPTVWISEGGRNNIPWEGNIRIFSIEQDGLKLVRDFAEEVRQEDPQPRTPYHGRQRLYFDHYNRQLYVGAQFPDPLHIKSFWEAIRIDPETGAGKVVALPFDCEDMAFDMDGHAYLRTLTQIARYDARTWREVPFDYGEEQQGLSYSAARSGRAAPRVGSAVQCRLEGNSSGQFYGMWVSPKGHVVITGCHRSPAAERSDERNVATAGIQRYEPDIYPGRPWGSLVHVFDRRGQLVYEDALPGSDYYQGIAMDKDDNLYVQHSGMPPAADGRFPADVHRNACTLIKLKPKSRFIAATGGIVPLPPGGRPDRPADFLSQGSTPVWIEQAEWLHGGVGLSTKASPGGHCHCFGNSRFAFDYFARSFVSELHRYRVTVLDANGNVILHIGQYGNADDGIPAPPPEAGRPVGSGGAAAAGSAGAEPPAAGGRRTPLGFDEVALMQALFLATQTDRRLFVADIGNYRIFSVRLDYHAEERVTLGAPRASAQ